MVSSDGRHGGQRSGAGGSVTPEPRHLITLRQAADLGPYAPRDIRRKIRDGVLLEGVHYTAPHRSDYLIVRDAYVAFLEGADAHLRKQAKGVRRSRRDPNWVNWDIASGM